MISQRVNRNEEEISHKTTKSKDQEEDKEKPLILIKYGGNAMVDENLKRQILRNICSLKQRGFQIVIVHGGGPFIQEALEQAKIESEFIDGHRKTTTEAFSYIEMALKGKVNGSIVKIINSIGFKAVGLSGKDGRAVIAQKRIHNRVINGQPQEVDLGQVGDVENIDTKIFSLLLENDFIPVLASLATDLAGNDYNVNADMFAGHLAGALHADQLLVLTDVDGLYMDKNDRDQIIQNMDVSDVKGLVEKGIIQGGMLPKIEACTIALNKGAQLSRIINGTIPDQILMAVENGAIGTLVTKK